MSNGINSVVIVGNLGADPELRYTQSGMAVTTLRVAVNERRKGEDVVHWFSVVVWDKQAENAAKYLEKGRQVGVTGRLQTRRYIDTKTGEERWTTEVVAHNVTFLGGGNGNGKDRAPEPAPIDDAAADAAAAGEGFEGEPQDLPF